MPRIIENTEKNLIGDKVRELRCLNIISPIDTYNNMCYHKGEQRMKSYSSREVIQMLEADGWYLVNTIGSHHQYKHPVKKGRVTVKHPDKDIPIKTLKSISQQSGITFP